MRSHVAIALNNTDSGSPGKLARHVEIEAAEVANSSATGNKKSRGEGDFRKHMCSVRHITSGQCILSIREYHYHVTVLRCSFGFIHYFEMKYIVPNYLCKYM